MAPTDRLQLPFRWAFVPERFAQDGSIRWKWRAYTNTGALALESDRTFETLTECMDDAGTHGYGSRGGGQLPGK